MIKRCGKLASFLCLYLVASGGFTSESSPMTEKANQAVEILKQKYTANEPGVAYLISHKGKVLASGGIGLANMEWGIPLSDSTLMRVGSISKSITAVAVLALVEDGKLQLDKAISAYAPGLPKHMGEVTLRQLLSHRAGIAEHAFDKELMPFVWQPMTTEQIIELQKHKSREFAPGAEYKYINFNYVLVAHVIESVTKMRFVDFINQEFFQRHKLTQSAYDQPLAIIANRAEFYQRNGKGILNAADIDLSHVSAAGALLLSAKDMHKWMTLLINEQLISQQMLSLAWTPQDLPDGSSTEYGLGFNITSFAGEKYIWHTGLTPGAQSAYAYAVESDVLVVVLSNVFYWPADTGNTVDEMMKILLE